MNLQRGLRRDKQGFANRVVGNSFVGELLAGAGNCCFFFGFGGFCSIIGPPRGNSEIFLKKA